MRTFIKDVMERRGDWIACGLLLAAALSLFLPVLFQPDYLLYPTFSPYSDLTVIHWPKIQLMSHSWRASTDLPLWTPANLSGMPLAANPLAMRFYPPAWLLLVVLPEVGFNLFFILHLFWGGLGLYWLLRTRFDLDMLPALVGGLAFALSGKLLAHMAGGHLSLVAAVSWMPWALWGVSMLLYAPLAKTGDYRRDEWERLRWATVSGLALAMQITTHTLILLYTGYLLAAYVIWQVAGQIWNGRRPTLAHLVSAECFSVAAVPALAALLGAAQLLPLVEMAGYSNRALSLAQAGEFALTPLSLWVALFLPTGQGGHEMVAYLGLTPLLLAAWGLSRDDRRGWFFAAVVVLAAIFALGPATPLFELTYRFAPGLSWVRTPARAFFVAALAVAVLAGMGAQRLKQARIRWSNPLALAIGAIALAVGVGLAALHHVNGSPLSLQGDRATVGLALFPTLMLFAVGLAAHRRLSPRRALAVLTCVLFLDLFSFGATMIRFVPREAAFAEGEPLAAYLAGLPGPFRTYSPSYSIPSHVAVRADLQTADGVEPVHLAVYDRFMELAGGYRQLLAGQPGEFGVTIPPFPPDRPPAQALRGIRPDLRLLGLLNVAYLAAAFPIEENGLTPVAELPGAFVYRNDYVLPRAWVLAEDAADEFMSTADERAWPEQLSALAQQSARSLADADWTADIAGYDADRIEIQARLGRPGLLVLSEIWYPGWVALVDDQAQPISSVAGLLRGVSLAAGSHHVTLQYAPVSVRLGTWVSLTTWLGMILCVLGLVRDLTPRLPSLRGKGEVVTRSRPQLSSTWRTLLASVIGLNGFSIKITPFSNTA